eukprot:TRINITY_DN5496_c0_g1_i2.p1 TRINITY_DN5496_c0_g1~~TRINITY_DN5496_c0_g1_i2.p1  ORF type:complete len:434 (+),score=86.60 TRINITY_DN5496_c0_g1_i2:68-1369(+)
MCDTRSCSEWRARVAERYGSTVATLEVLLHVVAYALPRFDERVSLVCAVATAAPIAARSASRVLLLAVREDAGKLPREQLLLWAQQAALFRGCCSVARALAGGALLVRVITAVMFDAVCSTGDLAGFKWLHAAVVEARRDGRLVSCADRNAVFAACCKSGRVALAQWGGTALRVRLEKQLELCAIYAGRHDTEWSEWALGYTHAGDDNDLAATFFLRVALGAANAGNEPVLLWALRSLAPLGAAATRHDDEILHACIAAGFTWAADWWDFTCLGGASWDAASPALLQAALDSKGTAAGLASPLEWVLDRALAATSTDTSRRRAWRDALGAALSSACARGDVLSAERLLRTRSALRPAHESDRALAVEALQRCCRCECGDTAKSVRGATFVRREFRAQLGGSTGVRRVYERLAGGVPLACMRWLVRNAADDTSL